MKIGTAILMIGALVAIGSFLTPFAALIYALFTFSIFEIIKGALIFYVAMIPVAMFIDARRVH